MIEKVESLIFKQAVGEPLVQLVNNQTVLISNRCSIKHFTDDVCQVDTPQGRYEVAGHNLRVAEYGDHFIRIESDLIEFIGFKKGGHKHE